MQLARRGEYAPPSQPETACRGLPALPGNANAFDTYAIGVYLSHRSFSKGGFVLNK